MNLNPSQIVETFLKDGVCVEKTASGDSMFPAIPSDSIVIIEPVLPYQIKRGDVVLFRGRDGHNKIHRIVRLFRRNGQKYIQAWGDNCQLPDPSVSISCVTGRIRAVKTDSGWRNIANQRKEYFRLSFSKYGLYYMKKISGKTRKVTTQQVLARLIYYSLIIQRIFYNGLMRLREFIAGLSLSVLSHEGVAHLNNLVYEAKKSYNNKGLFEWEKEWFENDLPTPPARLLIGGAGAGREVKSLIKKGYQIVAFDPVGRYVENAKQEILEKNCIDYLTGTYEDLLVKNSANTAINHAVHTHGPYDAVILGWGSFTHISDADKRLALLLKIKELCPQGPVLLSFWLKDDSEGAGRRKAFKIGYRIGNLLKNHGKQLSELPPEGDDITLHVGYGHFFIMPEIEKMIEACNYQRVENPKVSYLKYYPHITIRPSTQR